MAPGTTQGGRYYPLGSDAIGRDLLAGLMLGIQRSALVVTVIVASNFENAKTAVGVAVILGLFTWLDLSRIVRSQFLPLREREFVEAAHALGASNWRIISRHLIRRRPSGKYPTVAVLLPGRVVPAHRLGQSTWSAMESETHSILPTSGYALDISPGEA